MALVDFLYRCPLCGADPLVPRGKKGARCETGCGRDFRLSPDGREIVVRSPEGEDRMSPRALSRALAERGGALALAETADGRLRHEASVQVRRADAEAPVRYRGSLLGFFERFGIVRAGVLRLDGGLLVFEPSDQPAVHWAIEEIRALQASSSSLQISPAEGGVVQFRFPSDSARRWEELLEEALRREWRALGRGEITELQPRIRAS